MNWQIPVETALPCRRCKSRLARRVHCRAGLRLPASGMLVFMPGGYGQAARPSGLAPPAPDLQVWYIE